MTTRERMSPVDMAWLRMDGPGNLMMIVGVWIFDGPVERDALAVRLRGRLLAFDRFRQKTVPDATGWWWVDDDDFDLDRHLLTISLPSPADDTALSALIGELASQPLDPQRPLWQFHLVDNYQGGQKAMIARIHHCIADGIALVGVMLSMTDEALAAGVRTSAHRDDDHDAAGAAGELDLARAFLGPVRRTAVRAAQAAGAALGASIEIAGDGDARNALLDAGLRAGSDALKIALMTEDSPTPLKGTPGGRKAVAWNDPLPLAEVKAVCRVLGVSVNDVLLSCVAGALHRYLEDVGDHTAGKEIRAMVPVNLRPPDAPPSLGNRFGLVPLVLPVGIANPVERLFEVRRRMNELKGGFQGPIAYALLGAAGLLPRAAQKLVLDYLAHKGTAVMTNVPGPAHALRIAGRRLTRSLFWVPQSGTIGLGVSILSYDGGVQFGIIADTELCEQPRRIIDAFAPEFERLLLTLSMLPRELVEAGALDPREIERRLFGGATGPSLGPASVRASVKPRPTAAAQPPVRAKAGRPERTKPGRADRTNPGPMPAKHAGAA